MGTNHKDKGLPAAHAQVVWPIHKELLQDLEVSAVAQRAAPAGRIVVTEAMHVAACKVLLRAHGLDGLPQRMLDAMLAAAPAAPEAGQGGSYAQDGDRQMLLSIMQELENSVWNCEHCGHAEDTKTMDVAYMLRSYLAASQAEQQTIRPFLVRDFAELVGFDVPTVCIAIEKLGLPRSSTNSAIDPEDALRVAKLLAAQQAEREPQSREQAIAIARKAAVAARDESGNPAHSYLPLDSGERWSPHEWVVEAIVAAAGWLQTECEPLTDEQIEVLRKQDDCGEDAPEFARIIRIAERDLAGRWGVKLGGIGKEGS